MATPLDSCLLKIERAKEHRDALEKYERETFAVESNRPRLGIKFEPDTEDYVLFVNYMPDLNPFLDRYSLILGDAVHNLISALDRLAYQLALLHTGDNIQKPNSVQFPICDTTDKFERAKKRWLSEIAPDHVAIMERVQGYHRVDERHAIGPYFHPLSMLRDLVSLDKHRLPIELMIPTDSIASPTSGTVAIFTMGVMEQVLRAGSYKPCAAKLGAEVMRSKFPAPASEAKMDMVGYISPNVAIDGEYGAIGSFDKIAAVVINVVREFEPVF